MATDLGQVEIGRERVQLSRISCPVNLLAGATDHVTPPAQVFALADHVSTSPQEISQATTSGGHLGLFMGNEALREHWPVIFSEVAGRSGAHCHDTPLAEAVTAPYDPLLPAP